MGEGAATAQTLEIQGLRAEVSEFFELIHETLLCTEVGTVRESIGLNDRNACECSGIAVTENHLCSDEYRVRHRLKLFEDFLLVRVCADQVGI
jgi:hypothetical protein